MHALSRSRISTFITEFYDKQKKVIKFSLSITAANVFGQLIKSNLDS